MKVTVNLPKPEPRRHFGRRIVTTLVLVGVISAGMWSVFNRQFIIDQIIVWQHNMPTAVAMLAEDSGMNDHGRFLFAASRPELNDRESFNKNCTMRESLSIVLGCYSARRIYIFDVTDERVSGVRTVTAAHEMLHAAYERLGAGERKRVNQLLENQLTETTDPELLDLVKIYSRSEPGQELNELHSLFATIVANLMPELENYYKKYFADRGEIIRVYQKYNKVFTDLDARAKKIEKELKAKNAAIEAAINGYNRDTATLAADISAFNRCAKQQSCFSSQVAFQQGRAALIARQNALKNTANKINTKVEEYNTVVNELNALGIEAQRLNHSIDSRASVDQVL